MWTDDDERALLDPATLETLTAWRYDHALASWSAAMAYVPDVPGGVVGTLAEVGPIEPPSEDMRARRSYTLTGRAVWRDGRPT